MEAWLMWARGPAFRFALAILILGVVRLLVLQIAGLVVMHRRAGQQRVPLRQALAETARWLVPVRRHRTSQVFFTAVSLLFHVSIIITPIFLGAHIMLWERGLGLAWPALGPTVADVLTLVAVATALILFLERVRRRAARELSRPQDFIFPLLLAATCLSGFLAMHPQLHPVSYDAALLVHVLCGNVALALTPFSKLSHAILFPLTQLVSELGWHLARNSGQEVARALGKEGEAV
jgi:nitrate reductase gamma subunit